jgi:hypothetical protein
MSVGHDVERDSAVSKPTDDDRHHPGGPLIQIYDRLTY